MGLWTKLFAKDKSAPTTKSSSHVSPTPKAPAPQIKVVFMGTPPFAADILATLIEDGYHIVGVVTKADKPAGRKNELTVSAVKKLAIENNLQVLQPEKLDDAFYAVLKNLAPDILIVAAYGKILPARFLELPGFGAVNVHASLLPLYRGSSPIHNALIDGRTETGITLMQMDSGMDTGDIITQRTVKIDPDETLEQLTSKLTLLAKSMLREDLPLFVKHKLPLTPQPAGATLCQLIERSDGQVLWSDEAESLYNRYRALTPWPGLYTFWPQNNGLLRLKLHSIKLIKDVVLSPTHGLVLMHEGAIAVQAERGIIVLEDIQLEGRNRMSVNDFIKGNPTFVGSTLK
jgi:methionyl-tRNA formyltransferase